MKLQFIGTGTFGTKNRALTSFLINDEMLLDAGNGTVRGLQNSGAKLAKIKYLVITHFHLDHWPDALLLIMKRHSRISGVLTIVGPVGVREIITDTLTTYMSDVGSAEEFLGDTKFIELTDDEIVIDGYKIVARTVLHGDCTPVSGYEIAVGDARLGFSGDSTKCSGLDKIVEDSNQLFVDTTRDTASDDAHLNLGGALEYARQFPKKNFYLIHRGDYDLPNLPANVFAPGDGAVVDF